MPFWLPMVLLLVLLLVPRITAMLSPKSRCHSATARCSLCGPSLPSSSLPKTLRPNRCAPLTEGLRLRWSQMPVHVPNKKLRTSSTSSSPFFSHSSLHPSPFYSSYRYVRRCRGNITQGTHTRMRSRRQRGRKGIVVMVVLMMVLVEGGNSSTCCSSTSSGCRRRYHRHRRYRVQTGRSPASTAGVGGPGRCGGNACCLTRKA